MHQTLLAVGALVIVAFLTLTSQRQRGRASEDGTQIETQALTNRVAVDVLNLYRTLPFDGFTDDAPATQPSQLRPHDPLDPNPERRFDEVAARASAAAAAAGTLSGEDGRARSISRPTAHGAASFDVTTVVGYVAADGQAPSATPTKLKMATVRVQLMDSDSPPLYLSQLYACGSACDWTP